MGSPGNFNAKRRPDGKPKFRFFVDIRAVNSVTKFYCYPLPVLEETTYFWFQILFGTRLLQWILAGPYKGKASEANRIHCAIRALCIQ